jgi:uncharacterized protein DUF5715/transglycosylase-like protein with SLT domain
MDGSTTEVSEEGVPMTELVANLPRPRGPVRLVLLIAAIGAGLVLVGLAALRPHSDSRPAHGAVVHRVIPHKPAPTHHVSAPPVPATVPPPVADRLADDAARGVDRDLFTASPGGVVATAARVAAWRPSILRAVRGSGIGPNLLEALVLVESSGYADAVSPWGAAGLTQLSPAAARSLHLRVNLARSHALTTRIARADARGAIVTARQLRRWRARYDQRFSPARSLRATVAYLERARTIFGRDDLAVAAYHVGIPTMRATVASFGAETPSFAQLYFGSAPDRHRRTWRLVGRGGDYYWKVLAAKRVMTLYRRDASALRFEEVQQARKNSAEEVLHPRYRTLRFMTPAQIVRARRHHVLRAIPIDARVTHIAIDGSFGQEAHKLGRSRRLYRALRPAALDVLLYIGRNVHELSGTRAPLLLTSALRDNRYQRVLMHVNANAARTYSIHTTGYAFDIARLYGSSAQASAFEFVLDRLVAVNAIAYIREAAAIHVAVASDAPKKLRLLARAG